MPTDTFFRLEDGKRKRIMEAIVKECSDVSFEQVSINRIIKHADISRGSFYQYFEDKHDMFGYLMEDVIREFNELDARFLAEDVSIIEVLLEFYDVIVERCLYHPYGVMYQNLVKNYHISHSMQEIPPERLQERYSLLKERFQRQLNDQQFLALIQMVRTISCHAILEVLTEPTDLEEKRMLYLQQLQLLAQIQGGN